MRIGLLSLLVLPVVGAVQSARDNGPLTDAQYVAIARRGAPGATGANATVVRFDTATLQTRVLHRGTNGFTCTLDPVDDAPVCSDPPGWQWMLDALTGKERPTNTLPGVSYMAEGGTHFETPNGDIQMMPGPNTKPVREPPHWMLLWSFEAKGTGLPPHAGHNGVYVMYDGTPYAHLMVHQDPKTFLK